MLDAVHPEVVCDLGESPRWDPHARLLHWVDLRRRRLFTAPWSGPVRVLDLAPHAPPGSALGMVVPVAGGGVLAALGPGLVRVSAGGSVSPFRVLEPSGRLRLNDGACDPAGRLWVGSMALDAAPGAGSLFRVGPDGATRVLSGLTVPNGLGWSPDGRTMYVTDTGPRVIDAYDFDPAAGTLRRRRTLVRLRDGKPDGLAVDAEGCLWTATWTGRQIRRYGPDGAFLSAIDVPARQVTACAFAGPDLGALVITTGGTGPPPGSGRLFLAVPGPRGLPAAPFR